MFLTPKLETKIINVCAVHHLQVINERINRHIISLFASIATVINPEANNKCLNGLPFLLHIYPLIRSWTVLLFQSAEWFHRHLSMLINCLCIRNVCSINQLFYVAPQIKSLLIKIRGTCRQWNDCPLPIHLPYYITASESPKMWLKCWACINHMFLNFNIL